MRPSRALKRLLSEERARSPGGLIVAQSHIKVQDLFNKRNKKSFLKIRYSNLRWTSCCWLWPLVSAFLLWSQVCRCEIYFLNCLFEYVKISNQSIISTRKTEMLFQYVANVLSLLKEPVFNLFYICCDFGEIFCIELIYFFCGKYGTYGTQKVQ